MSNESIDIVITDKVSPDIETKIRGIARESRTAHDAVTKLKSALASLGSGNPVSRLQSELAKAAIAAQKLATETVKTQIAVTQLALAQNKAATAAQKLATEQQKTVTAANNAAAAYQKAVAAQSSVTEAQNKAAAAYQKYLAEQQKVITATNNAAASYQKLVSAQNAAAASAQNLAAATSNAATAATRTQVAAQRLATEQQRTAAATHGVTTAQQQAATAAQRLATEQQRTAAQAANAAAAQDRARLAALRLQQAQNGAAGGARNHSNALMQFGSKVLMVTGTVLGLVAILGRITSASDAYNTIQNRIRPVVDSQEQLAEVTERVFDIAVKTRMPVEEVARSFARFDNSLITLGKSQESTIRMTETINKLLKIGGAATQEQASALLQLSQAFNSNVLQGEEFRAISENMPKAVRQSISEVLQITESGLKKAASEGRITGEVLFKAFQRLEKFADSKFAQLIPIIGDSVGVLGTKVTKVFGEIDKAIGFTATISKSILAIADNVKVLSVALATVGAALLVYFGPALVGVLAFATKAIAAFTLAVLSNPLGALVVGLTAAVMAIVVFKNEIMSGSSEVRAMYAELQGLVDLVSGYFSPMLSEVSNYFRQLIGLQKDFSLGAYFLKGALEFLIEVFQVVAVISSDVVFVFKMVGQEIGAIAAQLAALARLDFEGFSAISDAVREDAKRARAELDEFQARVMSYGKGGAMDDEMRRMAGRAGMNAMPTNNLRGARPMRDKPTEDPNALKAAEKRATALARINAELDNELGRLYMLKPERDAQAQFDRIEEQLLSKKIKLTTEEATAIKTKIAAVQQATVVQAEFDRIYEEAIAPARDYAATIGAAEKLLSKGAISQDQYQRAIMQAAESYKQAKDPLLQYNRELEQQEKLLKLLPQAREVEQQLMQISNDLLQKGITLTEKETQALREKLTALQQLNAVQQQANAIHGQTVGARQQFSNSVTAIGQLQQDPKSGFTSGDAATATTGMLSNMGLDTTNLQVQSDAIVEQQRTMYAQIDELRAANLIKEQDAAALRMQVWSNGQAAQLQGANQFFGQLAQLQNSKNKEMAAIGKAAAITQTIIQTYTSATSAYAAMASIPYVGPALGAAAAAAAIAAGMANVNAIRSQNTGFFKGGYTGDIPSREVAGVVHGKEFVMDAESTSRIGVAKLEALRNGAAQVAQNGSNAGKASNAGSAAPASVGKAGATSVSVPVKVVNVIDPSESLAAMNSSEGERIIMNTIERNPGAIRKLINA